MPLALAALSLTLLAGPLLALGQIAAAEVRVAHNHMHTEQARTAAESGVELALAQLQGGAEAPFTLAAHYGTIGSTFAVQVIVDPADPDRRVVTSTGSTDNAHRTVMVTFEQSSPNVWAFVKGSYREISL